MGQAGHKVRDHRSADETCRGRTNEHSLGIQVVTPNKNGKILTQKEAGDNEQRSFVGDHFLFVETSNSEYELRENDDEPVITPEPGSSLSVDGLKHVWFDSARSEVTLGTDSEKRTPTKSTGEQQFQEIWSTNVDFSSIHSSFTMSSADEDQSSGDSPLSEENKRQVKVEEDRPESHEKMEDDESRWVMEFKQKEGEEVGVSKWDASRVPTSDDFTSCTAEEKNCYFQLVGDDDDFHALPTICFEDDYGEKDSLGSCAKMNFTEQEEREGSPVSTGIIKVCERSEKGESVQKRLFAEKKVDDRRMALNEDDGIESLDRSAEMELEGESPANSMVRRMCSTVKKMGFLSVFMRQWNRDVKKIDEDEDDQVRERKKEKEKKKQN